MKKTTFVKCVIAIVATFVIRVYAADVKNLLRNGNFDEGFARWSGDRKVETQDRNNVAYLELKIDSKQVIRQTFISPASPGLNVSLRWKTSPDINAEGFKVRIYAEDSDDVNYSSNYVAIHKTAEWKSLSWNMKAPPAGKTYYFEVYIGAGGKGRFYLDDIVLTGTNDTTDTGN